MTEQTDQRVIVALPSLFFGSSMFAPLIERMPERRWVTLGIIACRETLLSSICRYDFGCYEEQALKAGNRLGLIRVEG